MDDAAFAAMLRRATSSPSPELIDAMVTIARQQFSTPAPDTVAGHDTDGLLDPYTPPSEPPRRHFAIAVAAILVLLLGAGVAVLSWRGSPDGADRTHGAQNPGRLPARVTLGATPWTLTWLPPEYRIGQLGDDELSLVADGAPTITITARRGGALPDGNPIALAPQLNGILDATRRTMRWQQTGWTLTIHVADVPSSALLVRLATGIVESKRLQPPPALSTKTETIPDVVGLDYQDATRQLETRGFAVRWGISSVSTVNVGAVQTIRPSAGADLPRGSTIELGVIGLPYQQGSGQEQDDTFSGVSGDLPIAVGYWANRVQWSLIRIRPGGDLLMDLPQPIVFLRGELVGYGIGPDFETIQAAANDTQPPPSRSPITTAGGGASRPPVSTR